MKVSEYFENKEKFEKMIEDFFVYLCRNELEIYNEFSFQHELGIFLRNKLKIECDDGQTYKIEFERNAEKYFNINYNSFNTKRLKKEIDIAIYNKDHSKQYAIELKFPLNGQYPERMFNCIKDVRFMQELVNQKKFQKTYCITLVWATGRGTAFYKGNHEGSKGIDIYKYFRGAHKELLTGTIEKPTGRERYVIDLQDKTYPFEWKDCKIINNVRSSKYKERDCKYYIIESQ